MTALKDRFQAAFDARDPDDAFFLAEIPKLDPAPLVTYLKTVVAKIQKRPLSVPHWIKFKYECLTDYKDAQQELVNWATPSIQPERPYLMFDGRWDRMTTPEACVLFFLMIDNTSVDLGLKGGGIWKHLPSPP